MNLSPHESTIVLLLFNICTALAPARLLSLCRCLPLELSVWPFACSKAIGSWEIPPNVIQSLSFSPLGSLSSIAIRAGFEMHERIRRFCTVQATQMSRFEPLQVSVIKLAWHTSPIISIARRHPRSRLFSQPAKRIFTRAAGFYIASLLSSSEGSIGRQEFELEPHPCLFFDDCLPFHCLLFTAAAQEPAAFSFFLLPENQRRSRFWTRGFLLPRSRGSKKGTWRPKRGIYLLLFLYIHLHICIY